MSKQKYSDNSISDLTVDWGKDLTDAQQRPFSGAEVQKFVKNQLSGLSTSVSSKVGYVKIDKDVDTDESTDYYLYCFASEEDYGTWNDSGDQKKKDSPLVVTYDKIPDGNAILDSYAVSFEEKNALSVTITETSFKAYVCAYSQVRKAGQTDMKPLEESGTLTIIYAGGKKTMTLRTAATSETYTPIDLSPYLQNDATNEIKLTWKGETSNRLMTLSYNITVSSYGVAIADSFTQIVSPGDQAHVYLRTSGTIQKMVYLKMTENTQNGYYFGEPTTASTNLGTFEYHKIEQAQGVQTIQWAYDNLPEGLYKAEAWICVYTDKPTEFLAKTDPIPVQWLVSSRSNGIEVVFNNIRTAITNWAQNEILDYQFVGATTGSFKFVFWNSDRTKQYGAPFRVSDALQATKYTLRMQTELDIENPGDTTDVRLCVYNDSDEVTTATTPLNEAILTVDTSEDFSPTKVANGFILNPKTRSNGTSADVIYNEAAAEGSQEVTPTWANMDWLNGGWVADDDSNKCLRILAGSSVSIPYTNQWLDSDALTNGCTFEIDFAFRNVADSEEAVVKMCVEEEDQYEHTGNNSIGFIMYPSVAYFTATDNTKDDLLNRDVEYREDTRTHLVLNIKPNHTIDYVGIDGKTYSATGNIVRIYINGTINRELVFQSTARLRSIENLVIGSSSCDIDIYSIRMHKNSALESLAIRKDYEYSLPSIEKKKAFREANNICYNSNSDTIDYSKAKLKYNTLLYTGKYPRFEAPEEASGDLLVIRLKTDAGGNTVIDTDNSCKMTNLDVKGQGSTAKTYYKWNASWKFNDEKSEYYQVDSEGNALDTPLSGHNYYELVERDDNDNIVAITPHATKLVGKLNYASSMQSHKEGSLEMYEAIRNQLGFKSEIQKSKPLSRTAVLQEPYLLFVKSSDTATPQFYGLMTWGAGKGDKETFGCKVDKSNTVWVGGSTQTNPLTLMFAPWLDDGSVAYDTEDEVWKYNNTKAYDYEMGCVEVGTTTGDTNGPIKYVRDYQNFIFQHSHRLKPWKGSTKPTYSGSGTTKETSYQYWLTEGDDKYKVYRYDYPNQQWVDAGVKLGTDGKAVACEMKLTDFLSGITAEVSGVSYTIGTDSLNSLSVDDLNTLFKRARAEKLRKEIGNYTNVNDTLNCLCYTLFVEASDNLAKNSYFLVDKPDENGKQLVLPWRDDDDTIFRINNLGKKDKPYWAEMHTKHPSLNMENDEENVYFTASRSGYYGTLYYAFHEDLKERNKSYTPSIMSTMSNMIAAMGSLGADYLIDENGIDKPNVMGCFNRYFFKVQNYFPSVAYNEAARLLYEEAQLRTGEIFDRYNADPITMSLGDSLQGEIQFLKMRIFFMKTFAMYYDGLNRFGDQLAKDTDITVTAGAHMYVFSMANEKEVATNFPVLLEPGQSTVVHLNDTGNGLMKSIVGTEYISAMKGWHRGPIYDSGTKTVKIQSYRTTEFKAGDDVKANVLANYVKFEELPTVVETFNMQNVETFAGSVDLSSYKRLKNVNLSGTKVISLILPQSSTLTACTLSDNLQSITINKVPNLKVQDFSLETRSALQRISIVCHGGTNDYYGTANFATTTNQWLFSWWALMKATYGTNAGAICELNLNGVYWTMTASQAAELADMKTSLGKNFDINGTIIITDSFNQAQVTKITDAFGVNAFSSEASLVFKASQAVAFLTGPKEIREDQAGTATIITIGLENVEVTWSLSSEDEKMWISGQTNSSCNVYVGAINDEFARTLTATVTGINYTTLESYSVSLKQDIVARTYTYPNKSNATLNGVQLIKTQGVDYTYSLLDVDGSITATYNDTDTTTHGKYKLLWSIDEPYLNEREGYTSPCAKINGTLTEGKFIGRALKLRKIMDYANAQYPVDITCEVYYQDKIQATLTKRVFVGDQLLDTFGWLYCSDGSLYSSVDEIPKKVKPVGIVVVPARHTLGLNKDKGTHRVMSLLEMNTNTPGSGSTNYQGIYWGGFGTDIADLPNRTWLSNFSGQTINETRQGSETNYNGNLRYHNDGNDSGGTKTLYDGMPVDNLWYDSASATTMTDGPQRFGCNPFKGTPEDWENGLMEMNYVPSGDTGYGRLGSGTSDMDGKGNTTSILKNCLINDSSDDMLDWRTDSAITMSSTTGYYPAAEVCRRFKVDMDSEDLVGAKAVMTTKDYAGTDVDGNQRSAGDKDGNGAYYTLQYGDWYLPSIGELGYILPRFATLNKVLSSVKTKYGNSTAQTLHPWANYWACTETSSSHAWLVSTYSCSIGSWHYKTYQLCVRAFLAV